MREKNMYVFFIMAVLMSLTSCHTVHNISSVYRENPIKINGNLEEWDQDLRYDNSSELYYAVTHDKDNIYIALQTRDDMVQRKILMFGLTLWADTTGGKEKILGLRYPIPSKKREEIRTPGKSDEDLPLRAKQAIPENTRRIVKPALMDRMTLLGFNNVEKETISIAENIGISARIKRDKVKGLLYEALIPIDMLYSSGIVNDKSLSLGIITGNLEISKDKSGMISPGGMNPGGGMYPGSGRGRGQMGGNDRFGNLEELQKPTKLWLKNIRFNPETQ